MADEDGSCRSPARAVSKYEEPCTCARDEDRNEDGNEDEEDEDEDEDEEADEVVVDCAKSHAL